MNREYEEKRDFIRMQLDCKVQCKNLDNGETFYGHAQDLSSKGLALTVDKNLAPGTKMEVRIVPDKAVVSPLYARVEVVRVDPDTSGVRFNIGARIDEYLD